MTTEELKNMAPKLFEIENLKSGFVVPEKYFDSLESDIPVAVFLDSLPKENPFITPDNYLESIESSTLEFIENENAAIPEGYFDTIETNVFKKINKQPKVYSINKRALKFFAPIAVAASILLLFTLQFLDTNQNSDFSSLNPDEIELWLLDESLNFNTNELAYLYENTEIEVLNIYDFYEEDEVFDYLNDVDVESLISTN